MSSADEQEFQGFLQRALLDNTEAVRFISDVFAAAHVWDDIVDGDALNPGHFQRTFRDLFLNIPTNPFYMQHFTALHPIMLNAMLNWEAANKLEQMQIEDDLQIAFILRSSFIDLIGVTAFLLGGYDHAVAVVVEARQKEHSESFDVYKRGLL